MAKRREFIQQMGMGLAGVALASPYLARAQTSKPVVQLLADSNSLAEETREYIESSLDIKFNIVIYENEDQILQYFQNPQFAVDLAIVPHQVAAYLLQNQLLQPISWEKIRNNSVLKFDFELNDYDKLRDYSILVEYLFLGVAYNTRTANNKNPSWGVIFDSLPKNSNIFWKNYFSMIIQTASFYMGFGVNNTNRANFSQVEEMLREAYNKVSRSQMTLNGLQFEYNQVDYALAYSQEVSFAQQNKRPVGFINPKEGLLALESVGVIPKYSPKSESVHKLINLVLNPLVGKALSEELHSLTPYERTYRLTSLVYQNNKLINPTLNKSVKLEPLRSVDMNTYNYMVGMWNRITQKS